ncbi:MAG: hypothetical protein ACTS5I_17510 [Rhodanobacter sp.]
MTTVRLETESGTTLTNPSSGQIAEVLSSLDGKSNSYAILAHSDQVYVQTSGSIAGGFVLEHRNGDEGSHFQASNGSLPLDVIQDVFRKYADGDPAWKDSVSWEPWEAPTSGNIRLPAKLLAAAVMAVLAIAAWAALAA